MDLVVRQEGALDTPQLCASVREQHVAVAQQGLCAGLVQDGAGVNLARHLQGDAAGEVGFDEAGDHVHRWPLGRHDEVQTRRTRLLRQPRHRGFHVLGRCHHEIGKLVDDDDDVGQLARRGFAVLLGRLHSCGRGRDLLCPLLADGAVASRGHRRGLAVRLHLDLALYAILPRDE